MAPMPVTFRNSRLFIHITLAKFVSFCLSMYTLALEVNSKSRRKSLHALGSVLHPNLLLLAAALGVLGHDSHQLVGYIEFFQIGYIFF